MRAELWSNFRTSKFQAGLQFLLDGTLDLFRGCVSQGRQSFTLRGSHGTRRMLMNRGSRCRRLLRLPILEEQFLLALDSEQLQQYLQLQLQLQQHAQLDPDFWLAAGFLAG